MTEWFEVVRTDGFQEASRAMVISLIVGAAVLFSFSGNGTSYSSWDSSPSAEPICILYGWVNDSATLEGIGEALVMAVYFDDLSSNMTVTDETGYYVMDVPRGELIVESVASGYYFVMVSLDTTGTAEYRLDMSMDSEPTIPELQMSLDPNSNISLNNQLKADFTIEDYNLIMLEVIVGEVLDRNGDWVNMTMADAAVISIGSDFVMGTINYTYLDDVLTGNYSWSATSEIAGYLRNGTDSDYVTANWQRSINSIESHGIIGYYSNDSLVMEEGIAWFNDATGEYEAFQFMNMSTHDEPDLPAATPDDSAGMITPVLMVSQMKTNITSYYELYQSSISSKVLLDSRSIEDLSFDCSDVARSGEYIIYLLVIDEALNLNCTGRLFTVDTDPPVADAGGDRSVTIGEEVVLDASGSTDNVGIVNYTWSIVIDQYDTTVELYGSEISYEFEGLGYHPVILTVTDGGLNTASDSIAITVASDAPPTAEAGPSTMTVSEDEPVTFDGMASTDDVGIASYSWEISELMEYSTDPVFIFTFDNPGTYHVSLMVVDSIGQTSEPDTIVVTVTDETNPIADAGDDVNVVVGDTVTLDGSASTDNVGIITYRWSCDEIEDWESYGMTVELVMEPSGIFNYSFTLEVFDAAGNSDTDIVMVSTTITNSDPVADAGADLEVNVGDEVVFDASGSSTDGVIVNYTWTFEYDDETTMLFGEAAVFTFEIDGSYAVNLTITDNQGLKGYDEMTVTVKGESTFAAYVPYAVAALAALVLVVVAAVLLMKRRRPSV